MDHNHLDYHHKARLIELYLDQYMIKTKSQKESETVWFLVHQSKKYMNKTWRNTYKHQGLMKDHRE